VAIAEHLAAHYRASDRYTVEVEHRDVERTPPR
jgi:RNase adaptor protein for sRNA GlmZ degradation